jgi:integrase
VKVENSVLCPVKAYNDMLRLIPRDKDSPLFLFKSGNPVFYSNFQTVVIKKISQIGLNPDNYSTHSLRRGMATFAIRSGLSSDLIQLIGVHIHIKNIYNIPLKIKLQFQKNVLEFRKGID